MENIEPRQRFRTILEYLHRDTIDPAVGRPAFSPHELATMRTCARVVAEAQEDGMYYQRLRDQRLSAEHGPNSSRPLCLSPNSLAQYHHPLQVSRDVLR